MMECLVLVASVRKALFSGDAERSKFVLNIMQGVRNIIFTWQGMNDTGNYNEFCRLLFRFRATAPLNEMAEKPGYVEWIGLIADFTLKAVQSWKVTLVLLKSRSKLIRKKNKISGRQKQHIICLDFGSGSFKA